MYEYLSEQPPESLWPVGADVCARYSAGVELHSLMPQAVRLRRTRGGTAYLTPSAHYEQRAIIFG